MTLERTSTSVGSTITPMRRTKSPANDRLTLSSCSQTYRKVFTTQPFFESEEIGRIRKQGICKVGCDW